MFLFQLLQICLVGIYIADKWVMYARVRNAGAKTRKDRGYLRIGLENIEIETCSRLSS